MIKMKEGCKDYNEEAIEIALSLISIFPCSVCGHPLRDGYCCGYCGSDKSHHNDSEESQILYKAISNT